MPASSVSDNGARSTAGPGPMQAPSKRGFKCRSPQQKLDEYWRGFATRAPGKVTVTIPPNPHIEAAAQRSSKHTQASAQGASSTVSYKEAAALCRAKVQQIVLECRRTNTKYRDPHFDLECDLKTNRRNCLESLCNIRHDSDSDDDVPVVVHPGPPLPPLPYPGAPSPHPPSRALGTAKEGLAEEPMTPPKSPLRRDPQTKFRPLAVKRVCEIFDDPKLYIDGATAKDVRQGRDGDCWLMAALCTISNKPGLIERLCVAHDQKVGVYGFVFHRDGDWFGEIIDDKLYLTKADYDDVNIERWLWEDRDRVNSEETYRRTYQSNSGALYFAQCENPNETWLPLLEKAYAKAHGDYAAIEGGFTGEGIEDLTGGVTSEVTTTDILDREYFWKQELMKVNEQFLFGCSTGVWGRGYGERKGIMEGHAYSIMRAVEMEGERLVLLKNPWGKGEWKGAWSDGSKEWTPEWLHRLEHRFGDDGAFWISYEDLLRKYQAFDRTRLFGPEWKVTAIWTTFIVPWTADYHDTKFAFTLTRPSPVVLVLSQLDDRYFRGLEGQYRFNVSFRLHYHDPAADPNNEKHSSKDYLVRSQAVYRMNRSVNVELDLEQAGEYTVLVKIDATRYEGLMPTEDVVRRNVRNREKLIRTGLAYDQAHSKGKLMQSAAEMAARAKWEAQREQKRREDLRRLIRNEKQLVYVTKLRNLKFTRKRREKEERRRRRKQKKQTSSGSSGEEDAGLGSKGELDDEKRVERGQSKSRKQKKAKMTENTNRDVGMAKAEEKRKAQDKSLTTPKPQCKSKPGVAPKPEALRHKSFVKGSGESNSSTDGNTVNYTPSVSASEPSQSRGADEFENHGLGKGVDARDFVSTSTGRTDTKQCQNGAAVQDASTNTVAPLDVVGTSAKLMEQILHMVGQLEKKMDTFFNEKNKTPQQPPSRAGSGPPPNANAIPRQPPPNSRHNTHNRLLSLPAPGPLRFSAASPSVLRIPGTPPSTLPPPVVRPGPHPFSPPLNANTSPPGFDHFDSDGSVTSISDVSDSEVDWRIAELERNNRARGPPRIVLPPPPPLPPPVVSPNGGVNHSDGEAEREPWNAVAVLGLRVYYQVTDGGGEQKNGGEEEEEEKVVQLRIVRPNRWEVHSSSSDESEDGDSEGKKKKGKINEAGDSKDDKKKPRRKNDKRKAEACADDKQEDVQDTDVEDDKQAVSSVTHEAMDENKVLDLDDSARDATLEGQEMEMKIKKEEEEDDVDGADV